MKEFSQACENNRRPILEIIAPLFASCRAVLEIGSGTGQHAVYFGGRMPHLAWHTSGLPDEHASINAWIDDAALENVRRPVVLDVDREPWPTVEVDAVFSANTAHIMHWPQVRNMVRGVGELLPVNGLFVLYGPFNTDGRYTSESNARFDAWLKQRDPEMGIRDRTALNAEAAAAGLRLIADHDMPANNRTLVWRKAGMKDSHRFKRS